jgi:hypothetical protein
MYLTLNFLVSRAMIQYHIMIPLAYLSSLIIAPHQIFTKVACMILLMILALWLALGNKAIIFSGSKCFGYNIKAHLNITVKGGTIHNFFVPAHVFHQILRLSVILRPCTMPTHYCNLMKSCISPLLWAIVVEIKTLVYRSWVRIWILAGWWNSSWSEWQVFHCIG